jgi:isopentenyldiphosphate isomerase
VEWLWHVSEDDQPLGRVERADAHARAVRHRSGVVFLVDARGHVYLTQRAASKQIFPGRYDTSASFHVAHGESYELAAQREALEELGLALPLRMLGTFKHDDPPEHQFVAVLAMAHDGEPIKLDPSEASRGAFYSPSEVARIIRTEPCTPWLRDGFALLSTEGVEALATRCRGT